MEHEQTGRRQSDDVIVRLETKVESLITLVEDMKKALLGNGSSDNPGVVIRLDRLEQMEQSRTAHRMVLYSAVIALLVERGWHYLTLLRPAP